VREPGPESDVDSPDPINIDPPSALEYPCPLRIIIFPPPESEPKPATISTFPPVPPDPDFKCRLPPAASFEFDILSPADISISPACACKLLPLFTTTPPGVPKLSPDTNSIRPDDPSKEDPLERTTSPDDVIDDLALRLSVEEDITETLPPLSDAKPLSMVTEPLVNPTPVPRNRSPEDLEVDCPVPNITFPESSEVETPDEIITEPDILLDAPEAISTGPE